MRCLLRDYWYNKIYVGVEAVSLQLGRMRSRVLLVNDYLDVWGLTLIMILIRWPGSSLVPSQTDSGWS
jgi:hypothetical protein